MAHPVILPGPCRTSTRSDTPLVALGCTLRPGQANELPPLCLGPTRRGLLLCLFIWSLCEASAQLLSPTFRRHPPSSVSLTRASGSV
eukprot:2030281-Rhodomonas_salina.1